MDNTVRHSLQIRHSGTIRRPRTVINLIGRAQLNIRGFISRSGNLHTEIKEEQKSVPIPTTDAQLKLTSCIKKGSFRLSKSSKGKNYLTFVFTAKEAISINIYSFSIESFNAEHDTTGYSSLLVSQEFEPTDEQKFPPRMLCVSFDGSDEWLTTQPIPLLVELRPKLQPEYALTYYIKFSYEGELEVYKQKLHYRGHSYELSPIFKQDDAECVICLSAPVDTTLLPCKHCCLCEACSVELNKHSNKTCPVCRSKIASFSSAKGV
mmetsp:Transcript_3706/g.7924  ORF Transcript_3706/g.7924 Transcript_3706/m.7924 type:complete len:264 (+) Transcript_3706:2260-3051(+)